MGFQRRMMKTRDYVSDTSFITVIYMNDKVNNPL